MTTGQGPAREDAMWSVVRAMAELFAPGMLVTSRYLISRPIAYRTAGHEVTRP